MSDEQQGQAPEAADTTNTQQADTGQQDTQTTTPEAKQEQAASDKPKSTDPWADPETARKEIERLRRENASTRTNAKQQAAQEAVSELTEKLGRALGLVKDDHPPTADELTKQLTEAAKERDSTQSELRQLRVERAAEKAARTHGADVDTLLDSRSFAQKLSDLDPTADDFAATVSDLVKTTVDSNPKYRVAQAATSSSADFSSGPGEQRTRKPIGLHAAFRNHYSG